MIHYDTARSKLDTPERDALDAILGDWDGAKDLPAQAAANLRAEFGLEVGDLAKYLGDLARARVRLRAGAPGLQVEFDQIGNTFGLAGHVATPYAGAIFGRAVLLDKYARHLKSAFADNRLACNDELDRVVKTLRAISGETEASASLKYQVYFDGMKRTMLGLGAVFATFVKPVDAGQLPWPSPAPTASRVRNSMALGEDEPGKDYILFSYRLPSDKPPRVPTTASPGWFYQRWFRPNQQAMADLHGLTAPPVGTDAARPEIVHEALTGTTILFPLLVASA